VKYQTIPRVSDGKLVMTPSREWKDRFEGDDDAADNFGERFLYEFANSRKRGKQETIWMRYVAHGLAIRNDDYEELEGAHSLLF